MRLDVVFERKPRAVYRDRCLVVLQRATVSALLILSPKERSERRYVEEGVIERKPRAANRECCQIVVGQVGVPALVVVSPTKRLEFRAFPGDTVAQKKGGVHGDYYPGDFSDRRMYQRW